MDYGASANNSTSMGGTECATSTERSGPGMTWLFSAWPVRERLADI